MSDEMIFTNLSDLQKLIRGASNSQSMAMLNSVMADTIGMSMHNAVSTQHNAQMLNSAATTSTCARILSVMGIQQVEPPPAPVPPPAPAPPPPQDVATTGNTVNVPTPPAGKTGEDKGIDAPTQNPVTGNTDNDTQNTTG